MRKLTVMLAGIAVLAAGVTAVADDDDDHDHDRRRGRSAAVMPPDPVYVKECGSCHLAYPARLLPARSWQRLLGELNDHFGDNAELGPDERTAVGHYLVGNAADSSWNRSPKVMQSLRPEEIPLRVTETGYFKRKHREIPARAINANPGVVSLAQCQACHPRAEAGSYNEHDVAIPGIGRWERN